MLVRNFRPEEAGFGAAADAGGGGAVVGAAPVSATAEVPRTEASFRRGVPGWPPLRSWRAGTVAGGGAVVDAALAGGSAVAAVAVGTVELAEAAEAAGSWTAGVGGLP